MNEKNTHCDKISIDIEWTPWKWFHENRENFTLERTKFHGWPFIMKIRNIYVHVYVYIAFVMVSLGTTGVIEKSFAHCSGRETFVVLCDNEGNLITIYRSRTGWGVLLSYVLVI